VILGVIPARLNSTRFPKKVTYKLNDKSIVQHVYEQACKSKILNKIIVAVDSDEIINSLENPEVAIMTSVSHKSGTDRVAEVARKFDCEIVVNIQGDEPGIEPKIIDDLVSLFDDPNVEMASVASRELEPEDLLNPNVVKVDLTKNNFAKSFLRTDLINSSKYYRHIGIYAFRKKTLDRFTKMKPSKNELSKSLEQLRALDNNIAIKLLICDFKHSSIDTIEDLKSYEK